MEKRKMDVLEYDLFRHCTDIFAGTTLRHGGVSQGPFFSLNLGKNVGDDPEHVNSNRERVQMAMRVSCLVEANQVHGKNICKVTKDNYHKLPAADGIYTYEPNIALMIRHADCQAMILYHPKKQLIGAVHAGWKGLMLNIHGEMIRILKEKEHIDPKELLVAISPSIGPCHAEYKEFRKDFPKEYWAYEKEKYHFDFWELAKDQLLQAGIVEKNLEIARICTYCDSDNYFSYRRDKTTGRHGTCIALKNL